ncbi:unnamed protein product, partial [Brassica napus]
WPKAIHLQRQKMILKQGWKAPPSITSLRLSARFLVKSIT